MIWGVLSCVIIFEWFSLRPVSAESGRVVSVSLSRKWLESFFQCYKRRLDVL